MCAPLPPPATYVRHRSALLPLPPLRPNQQPHRARRIKRTQGSWAGIGVKGGGLWGHFQSSYWGFAEGCESGWRAVTGGWRCSWGRRWGMGQPGPVRQQGATGVRKAFMCKKAQESHPQPRRRLPSAPPQFQLKIGCRSPNRVTKVTETTPGAVRTGHWLRGGGHAQEGPPALGRRRYNKHEHKGARGSDRAKHRPRPCGRSNDRPQHSPPRGHTVF